ncbi:MAG: hypothetical protein Q8K59_12885 [Nitrosomonas sp.]|nr:hypothetical protein [Nitrosomonas sp.]MDP1951957.1 hypothetical protein [Nitrosomonas sp.]
MTATIPALNESIERMKQEILEDIKAGRVPADCPSFSSLHDHVDANCYGGFCDDAEMQSLIDHFDGINEEKGMSDALISYLNDAQNSIDHWIKDGGIKQHTA